MASLEQGKIGVACLILRMQEDKEQDQFQLIGYLEEALAKRGVPPEKIYKLVSPLITPDDVLRLLKCVRWSTATHDGTEAPTDIVYVHCPAKTEGGKALLRLTGVDEDGTADEDSEATLGCDEVVRRVQARGSARPYVFFDTVFNTACWLTSRLERGRHDNPTMAHRTFRTIGLNRPEKDTKRTGPREVTFQLVPRQTAAHSDPVVVYSSDPEMEKPREIENLLGDSLANELQSRRNLRSLPQAVARSVQSSAPLVLQDANHLPLVLFSSTDGSAQQAQDENADSAGDTEPYEPLDEPQPEAAELQVAEPRLLFQMDWVKDLSLPDNSEVECGKLLRKEWRVRNPGARWPPGCCLVPYSGFPFCYGTRVEAPELETGAEHDFAVEFIIQGEPVQPRYQAIWRMQDRKAAWFGEWLRLDVSIRDSSAFSADTADTADANSGHGDPNPDIMPLGLSFTAASATSTEPEAASPRSDTSGNSQNLDQQSQPEAPLPTGITASETPVAEDPAAAHGNDISTTGRPTGFVTDSLVSPNTA